MVANLITILITIFTVYILYSAFCFFFFSFQKFDLFLFLFLFSISGGPGIVGLLLPSAALATGRLFTTHAAVQVRGGISLLLEVEIFNENELIFFLILRK